MASSQSPESSQEQKLSELNLGLNDGTYAPQACVDALRTFDQRTSFRWYTTSTNEPLLNTIAKNDGVHPKNIFLHNGSGPILKLAIPHLLRSRVLASPLRTLRHLIKRDGYPIITPRFTYSKVPKKAAEGGMRVDMLSLRAENGFALDIDELTTRLKKGPGMVYLANPNNPTGNLLIQRPQLVQLLNQFPESRFWIDEAYVQYINHQDHRYLSDLVPHHDNLIVSRTFSFAYGLAGLRIGYLLAAPQFVSELEGKLTDYRLGTVQERLAIAALGDKEHLPFIQTQTQVGREQITNDLAECDEIEVFPSLANFLLCRLTNGKSGMALAKALSQEGIRIKHFEAFGDVSYEPYFRLTVGLTDENKRLCTAIKKVLPRL